MGFSVMQNSHGRIWVPVDNADRSSWETLYVGQLVKFTSDGAVNFGQASGAYDATNDVTPAGVVVGHNLRTPVYNSTYKAEYITATDPHANITEHVLHGGSGLAIVGDTAAYVLVDLIGPETVLKGRIFNGSYGAAITVGTVTTASTTGAGFTCSGGLLNFAGTVVADCHTVYCRTGLNRGIYRIGTNNSATVITVGMYFPYDIALGDTFVGCHLRAWGPSTFQTDSEAMFIDAAGDTGTNSWGVFVLKLDLSVAGQEYALFRFDGEHFASATYTE